MTRPLLETDIYMIVSWANYSYDKHIVNYVRIIVGSEELSGERLKAGEERPLVMKRIGGEVARLGIL